VAFVDELVSLGVLRKVAKGKMKRNGPLLVIPKERQPGQWRVLSDMKRGGQNAYIAKDPVALPRLQDMLAALCPGGYSAVIDVSKEFYHFPTTKQDQPYLGLVHPATGDHYLYTGIPMGSASSPGVAGQGVAALSRALARENLFQGDIRINDITNHLNSAPYWTDWPEGRVTIKDGHPIPPVFIWVDDFLIHAATRELCTEALNLVMDHLVRLGLLAQKRKVKAPAQSQRFCGFQYDTTGVPRVNIPTDKRDSAVALIDYLARSRGRRLSRLTLAIIIGRLQS
jgi:hypothetical protein